MKFLLDANMPRSAANELRELGHEVEDVRDVLPPGADDALVASLAKTRQQVLITRDFDFADIRNYPPANFAGIIVLDLPEDAVAAQINRDVALFCQPAGTAVAAAWPAGNRGIMAGSFPAK
jgi:predicted nuclease of predicted toxin-antitoxin system